jgi:hypothetical protein
MSYYAWLGSMGSRASRYVTLPKVKDFIEAKAVRALAYTFKKIFIL